MYYVVALIPPTEMDILGDLPSIVKYRKYPGISGNDRETSTIHRVLDFLRSRLEPHQFHIFCTILSSRHSSCSLLFYCIVSVLINKNIHSFKYAMIQNAQRESKSPRVAGLQLNSTRRAADFVGDPLGPINQTTLDIGNESVPKIMMNDTLNFFKAAINNFGNFKPKQFPSAV